ncbi:MAG: aminomethyltransferase family protein [Geminicoccaceae bacterium]
MIALDHFRTPLETTHFTPRLQQANRQQRWAGWAGYLSATVLDTVEQEYFAIRNQATVYDLCPMIKYRIEGPDAAAFLDRLVVRDMKKLKPGRVAYVAWCEGQGKVLDDGTVFRLDEDRFLLCCQERHLPWLHDTALGMEVRITDATAEIAALSLQGPTSCAVLKGLRLSGVEQLRPYALATFPFAGGELMVSRTGFTGDLGYELWIEPAKALALWDALFEAGALHGLRPVGSEALDITRIEAGFIMTGAEFTPADKAMRASRGRSPFELGLGWMVALDKGHFVGRRALALEKATRSSKRALVGLDVAGNKPAHHALLYHGRSREVGHVTSAAWSPTAKKNLALASIDAAYAGGYRSIWADVYADKEGKWDRVEAPCRIVERPFFNPPRRWAVPALDR